jgi:metal-responsive CopG/Arc/MetJ family transcriptional regulator
MWYNFPMKAIQVTFDEQLLAKLDATEEARRHGRSALLRRAAAEYLLRQDSLRVAEAYRAAYASTSELDRELEGWEEEGTWPAE